MTDWFDTLPALWQAIFSGIAVILLWEIVKLLLKITTKQILSSQTTKQNTIDKLNTFITSNDPLERTEGSVEFIFLILRYLFIGNMLWVLPEILAPIFGLWELELLKIAGGIYFAIGLRWILIYLKMKTSNKAL